MIESFAQKTQEKFEASPKLDSREQCLESSAKEEIMNNEVFCTLMSEKNVFFGALCLSDVVKMNFRNRLFYEHQVAQKAF